MDAPDRLIERDGPVRLVEAALERALAGEGELVFLEGPAGIGKSRLVAHAAALCQARGMTVLRGRGGELEHDVTFGVARQLFEALLHRMPADERAAALEGAARLAATAIGSAPPDVAFSPETGPAHGLYWLVSNLAQGGPMALVVDDAHWADDESLRFFAYLARRLSGLPVLVLLAARPRETGSSSRLLDLLAAESRGDRLTLDPLTAAGTGALLAERLGQAVDPAVVDACHEVAGGNPFFVREIAGELGVDGAGSVDELVAQVRTLLPRTVMRSILLRLGRESAATRTVGVTLAVIGDHASLELVRVVAQMERADVVQALDRLADVGLGARTGVIGLAHPVIRTSIYADLAEPRRRQLHREVARALIDQAAAPEEIAQHLLLTEPEGDDGVAGALLAAGTSALARGASDTASRLLARALAEPPPAARRADVLIALGDADRARGAMADAVPHLREALELELPSGRRREAVLGLAQALVLAEGQQSAIDALAREGARLDGDDALRVGLEQTLLSMYVADHLEAAKERLRAYAGLPGATPTERFALAAVQLAVAIDRDSPAAAVAPLAERAYGDGRLLEEQTADSESVANAFYTLRYTEELDEFDARLRLGFGDAQARGSVFGFFSMTFGSQVVAAARGDTAAVVSHGDRARATLPDLPERVLTQLWHACVIRFSTEALLHRGEADRARALVAEGEALGDPDSFHLGMVRFARGLLAESEGDHERALTEYLTFGAFYTAAGWETRDTPWRLAAARCASALGRGEDAVALADEALAIATRWGTPGGIGEAQHGRALAGPPTEATARLGEAVTALRTSPLRLALARAMIDLGMAQRRDGTRTDARQTLAEGMGLAAECGALPLAERARDELRVLGARPRRLAFSGVDSLTASERRVAELVAEGLTNRAVAQALFVTPRTVEAHLHVVYRKLGINSRRDIPASLAAGAPAA
jgi:DNA-binding CsgD family transcriptional regulator/tetratricopeptide (TPR) repeat protein